MSPSRSGGETSLRSRGERFSCPCTAATVAPIGARSAASIASERMPDVPMPAWIWTHLVQFLHEARSGDVVLHVERGWVTGATVRERIVVDAEVEKEKR
jgi:hypothetical protein